jgi:hypothetical protein
MISDKRKLELVKELLKDHKEQKINSFASMIALQLIVDPKKPSKECTEWAGNVIREIENEN